MADQIWYGPVNKSRTITYTEVFIEKLNYLSSSPYHDSGVGTLVYFQKLGRDFSNLIWWKFVKIAKMIDIAL